MQKYQNLDGDSGIDQFETGADYITVQFKDGTCYKYSYRTPGIAHVDHMKQLAQAGRGLNEYIKRNPDVDKGYESKW